MAQQLYMIEVLIDKISIFVREDDPDQDTNKGFMIQLKLGPKDIVNFKENHLANVSRKDAVVACADGQYDKKWTRTIRVGKSYLFPSYPDQLVITLGQFPIEVQVWTDSQKEITEFIGNGIVKWDARFYNYLKENANPKHLHEAFALKQTIIVYHDILPGRAGEIDVILRLSALGESITTEFQQIPGKEFFVFRTNKVPTMFFCERTEGDDINFCMVGNVYETITLEDPVVIENMNQKIEVCTELDSCKPHEDDDIEHLPIAFPIEKIKMKDIVGPCGNSNCPLAHKIKTYIRALDYYKAASKGVKFTDKNLKEGRNVCGTCGCKEDRWHRETCPELDKKPVCTGCGGIAKSGETCEDRIKRIHGKDDTKDDKTDKSPNTKQVNYLTSITRDPEQNQSIFGQTFIVNPCEIRYENITTNMPPRKYCTCGQNVDMSKSDDNYFSASNSRSMGNISALVYNADVKVDAKNSSKFCIDIPDDTKDKECKCNPPIPTPPCKTFDCECLLRAAEKESRRKHKSYCPVYKHKPTCPVTHMNDEEMIEFEEDEAETLPYGLPPVSVGPCPVIGRPCSVPDGFARMYKTAAMPTQPVSYSEAGKVCCSAEFNRIKKAILEYMKAHEKADDYRCLNKFNFDTEKRCCDKEQRLLGLLGKSCCGSNKLASAQDDKNKKK